MTDELRPRAPWRAIDTPADVDGDDEDALGLEPLVVDAEAAPPGDDLAADGDAPLDLVWLGDASRGLEEFAPHREHDAVAPHLGDLALRPTGSEDGAVWAAPPRWSPRRLAWPAVIVLAGVAVISGLERRVPDEERRIAQIEPEAAAVAAAERVETLADAGLDGGATAEPPGDASGGHEPLFEPPPVTTAPNAEDVTTAAARAAAPEPEPMPHEGPRAPSWPSPPVAAPPAVAREAAIPPHLQVGEPPLVGSSGAPTAMPGDQERAAPIRTAAAPMAPVVVEEPALARLEPPPATQPPAAASARAAAPPAALAPDVTRREREAVAIERVLGQYRTAFNRLDAGAAAAVWPTVNEKALARAFESLDDQAVEFDDCQYDIDDDRAEAACRGTARYVPNIGSRTPRVDARQWRFSLDRGAGGWRIVSVDAR